MKSWFKNFLWIIPLFSFTFSASSMEEGCGDNSNEETSNTKSLRKIGVEIETSAIKIKFAGRLDVGFTFKSGEKEWKLEDDTRDTKESVVPPLYNLEMKTVGGYGFDEFISILGLMTNLLKEIYDIPSESEEEEIKVLSLAKLNEIIIKLGHDEYSISNLIPLQPDLEFIIKDHTDVRPQITYEVPLNEIPRIFYRVADLGHETVKNFLGVFSDNFEDFEIEERYAEKGKFKKLFLLNFFNKEFSEKINDSHLSKNTVGFSYLFLFYWENLFHNGIPNLSPEPGPKSSLTIMSRIPFSEMYDYCLEGKEKEQFKKLFNDTLNKVGNEYKLIKYHTEEGKAFKEMTLLEWYTSILNEDISIQEEENKSKGKGKGKGKGKTNKKKWFRKLHDSHKVDLLSPPSQLDKNYSMGAYHIKKDSPLALLEVRGYVTLFDATIENVYNKVSEEAIWFFK